MTKTSLAVRLKSIRTQLGGPRVPATEAYRAYRNRFLRKRLDLTLIIAIAAYLTFILLRFGLSTTRMIEWDGSWFAMATVAELGLLLNILLNGTALGRKRPTLIFLGCSWSITLIEQMWATFRGEAFIAVFSWTLVFLAQATLIPVCWRLHLVSQLGVFAYYFGINSLLGLRDPDAQFWGVMVWLYFFWFCIICNLAVYLYERLQQAEYNARRALEAERQKSERLLLNILPEAVANQLKQEHRTIAEHFADVTVLFADIVGFTQLSVLIPPNEMVTLLNQIFSSFDYLAERHGLEKIKTIGDSYMVVGGLPLERENHLEAIADMALDMLEAIHQFNLDQTQTFNIRIGIHTGPVVAGVIGVKKFIYDLWGDTVNIASRMESQGLAGCIQVTEGVYERLKEGYTFEQRGSIHVKGKGDMTTYLLKSKANRKLPLPASASR